MKGGGDLSNYSPALNTFSRPASDVKFFSLSKKFDVPRCTNVHLRFIVELFQWFFGCKERGTVPLDAVQRATDKYVRISH